MKEQQIEELQKLNVKKEMVSEETRKRLGKLLKTFEEAENTEQLWNCFDNILLLARDNQNLSFVRELELAEHQICQNAEEETSAEYKAGLVAGLAQALVAVNRLFPIPKREGEENGK